MKDESARVRVILRIYATAGATLGIVIGLALSFYLGMFAHVGDTLLFCLYHAVLFAIPTAASGILVHAVRAALVRFGGGEKRLSDRRFHRRFASGLVTGVIACLSLILWFRPFLLTAGSSLLLLCVFIVAFILGGRVASGLAEMVSRTLSALERPFLRWTFMPLLSAIVITAVILAGRPDTSTLPDGRTPDVTVEKGYRVLLIGLDGATWRIIDRMTADGELPNLAMLTEQGVRCDLASEVSPLNPIANTSSAGMRSASVWTSIATGKSARSHGIYDFMESRITGIPHPVPARVPTWNLFRKPVQSLGFFPVDRKSITPASRREATLWEIASACSLSVGIQGWWLTDAGLPVKGHKVSPGFHADMTRFYPPSLLEREEIVNLLEHGDESPDISSFTSFEFDPDYRDHYRRRDREYRYNSLVHMLLSDLRRDEFILRASLILGDLSPVDFNAVYFLGPDNVEHLFWKYMDPQHFGVTDEEKAVFGGVIENYYRYLDDAVGELLSLRDEETVVIICSDHGMGPWVGNTSRLYRAVMGRTHLRNSGNHRLNGILIMHGGPCKKGKRLGGRRVTVHDITPTILHLLGLPVAVDMDGSVITEAFVDEFLDGSPVRTVSSYHSVRKNVGESITGNDGEEDLYRERLKALGYIE